MLQNLPIMLSGISPIFCLLCSFLCSLDMHYADNLCIFFLDDVVLVAGVDGTWAQTHGNGQINYGTDYYFNTAHGLNVYTYLKSNKKR